PTVVKWDKGGEIMTLPLRDAREVFEREYLIAQVTRFGGNISRTAAFVGMERSALPRKLKSLGVFGNDRPLKIGARYRFKWGTRQRLLKRIKQGRGYRMSPVAYVEGQY